MDDAEETVGIVDKAPAITDNYYSMGAAPNITARIPLLATTQEALHAEIMSIQGGGPFHVVLGDLMRDTIKMDFLRGCSSLASCVIKCCKVTVIEKWFFHNCTALSTFQGCAA